MKRPTVAEALDALGTKGYAWDAAGRGKRPRVSGIPHANGFALLVEYTNGCEVYVPASLAIVRACVAMERGPRRKPHPDLPGTEAGPFHVRAFPAGLVEIGPGLAHYTPAQARAIALELLHASDLADDAAAKAGG